jgi:sortase A
LRSIRSVVLGLFSLAMIGAGVALIGYFFLGGSGGTATNGEEPAAFNVPELENKQEAVEDTGGPEDKTLKLTVPQMARVEDAPVPDAAGDDEEALKNYAAIHLQGTGFPWQEEANVYLAGHRLGYPNEPSFLAFWDLDALEQGDEVFVEDADGKKYTYKVFKEFVVNPTDLYVTEPVPGKNILTLQTCTLPDYSQRLIVQAELVDQET